MIHHTARRMLARRSTRHLAASTVFEAAARRSLKMTFLPTHSQSIGRPYSRGGRIYFFLIYLLLSNIDKYSDGIRSTPQCAANINKLPNRCQCATNCSSISKLKKYSNDDAINSIALFAAFKNKLPLVIKLRSSCSIDGIASRHSRQ